MSGCSLQSAMSSYNILPCTVHLPYTLRPNSMRARNVSPCSYGLIGNRLNLNCVFDVMGRTTHPDRHQLTHPPSSLKNVPRRRPFCMSYIHPHLGWIAARSPNRVNRAHGPTKESRQNLCNFWIFPDYGKNGPGGPQMGRGRLSPA